MTKRKEYSPTVFGTRILIQLGKLDMSQAKLADTLGCARETINMYVNGHVIPKVDRAAEIAKILGVSLDWLCGISDVENIVDPNIPISNDIAAFADKCAELRNILSIIEEQAREAMIQEEEKNYEELEALERNL